MLLLDCVLQYGLSHADYHPKELSYTLLHDILDIPNNRHPLFFVLLILNVFLHDTSEQSLFKKTERAFSHGCISVEHAEKLAGLILKNDKNSKNLSFLNKSLSNYKTQTFNLRTPLAIKVTYLTCTVNEGAFITYKDIYRLDKDLENALYEQKNDIVN